ncbi:hypothetical protein LUD75_14395 [Epilithonimonas sp. JDS]|uniref:hypothetical protein n=1 Tax=Epilithonimonas sp. JDS TaxID=2902797 RepID=UPI001E41018E|nr:hypothetical protein [Epilithonimonas sp. JDS]MCD9855912.1 hypothetical protein [Epilithonimonas sp. JDS]
MKEKLYKNFSLSLIIINFWSICMFFDSFTEPPGLFAGFRTLAYFLYTMMFAIILGIIVISFRIIMRKKQNENKQNFFYLFAGILNLNLLIIYVVATLLKLIYLDQGWIIVLAISNLLISFFILFDLLKMKEILED